MDSRGGLCPDVPNSFGAAMTGMSRDSLGSESDKLSRTTTREIFGDGLLHQVFQFTGTGRVSLTLD